MKRSVKIILIVIPIILIVAGASTFVGTLLFTKNNVTHDVGDARVSNLIQKITIPAFPVPTIEYTGYIVVAVPFEIANNGYYNFNDLVISIKVYGQNFNNSLAESLNGKLLGHGENTIGSVPKGENWSGELEINMTLEIALLAVFEGELRIEAHVSLTIDFLIYSAPVTFDDTQIEVWGAKY